MTDDSDTELAPCPNCHGKLANGWTGRPMIEELQTGAWRVICYLCNCVEQATRATRAEAIVAWNAAAKERQAHDQPGPI
jgi:hypothetical protein